MSAIWGIVNINSDDISLREKIITSISSEYAKYKIDRREIHSTEEFCFACEHQYITPESISEKLPLIDKNIVFTADCMIDNRKDLINAFSVSSDTPDGTLLSTAWNTYGKNFGKYAYGAFSFAAYDHNHHSLHLATDHLANRSIYYTKYKGYVIFSSLIAPLAKATDATICEKWMVGCLSNTSADMMIANDVTPFSGIYQIHNATILTIDTLSGNTRSEKYWSARHIKPVRNLSLETCRDKYVSVINTAVKSKLRSISETGCTLSAGLDSSTVACLAAPMLNEQNKKLYSFTSLPLTDYINDQDDYAITDESSGVNDICKEYPNISPTFLRCEGLDAFSAIDEIVPECGYPLKSGQNLTWLNEIYKTAASSNCKIMLKGQYGNSTTSYGNALTTFYLLLHSFQFNKARKTAGSFCQRNRIPRKYFVKCFFEELNRHYFPQKYNFDTSIVDKKSLKKHNIPNILKKDLLASGPSEISTWKNRINAIENDVALLQLGMYDTFMSVKYGIMVRDPLKDVQVIETILSLPYEAMLAGGLERGMSRTFMQNIIPDSIRLDVNHRGLQSADYFFRVKKYWKDHSERILGRLSFEDYLPYIDNVQKDIIINRVSSEPTNNFEYGDMLYLNSLYSALTLAINYNK